MNATGQARSERRFVLALDQGTTSSRAIVFDDTGKPVAQAQQEFPQIFPQPGWVEHDAEQIWASQLTCARQALRGAGLSATDLAAIGIANQRETVVLWERAGGRPLCNAIVWQDRRTADACVRLREQGVEPDIAQRTGLLLDPYFSATKIAWLLDHVPGARRRAERGELACGTVDSWLIWKLTGGAVHATDATNASRTLLFNLHTQAWDAKLLQHFSVPSSLLPAIVPSSGEVGRSDASLFGAPVPISGIAGDQQAALFGQTCFDPGCAKNTYGTGCFLLMNVGGRPQLSVNRLLCTQAWSIGGQRAFALEGSVFIGGAVVQWLRDALRLVERADQIEALAALVPDSGGVEFVPAFAGLGAPYWDPLARGLLAGLTRGTKAAHIARAALESIALQSADVLAAMQADAATPIVELRVDGGAAANDLLMQMQADLIGVPVIRSAVRETTALGAAWLAGLGAGLWTGLDEIRRFWRSDRVFEPTWDMARRQQRMADWRRAVERARHGM